MTSFYITSSNRRLAPILRPEPLGVVVRVVHEVREVVVEGGCAGARDLDLLPVTRLTRDLAAPLEPDTRGSLDNVILCFFTVFQKYFR